MSKPRYGWWGYAISMVRRYPETAKQLGIAQKITPSYSGQPSGGGDSRPIERIVLHALTTTAGRECIAVSRAIEQTARMRDGKARLAVIDLMYWKNTHNLFGASQAVHASYHTAQRWHAEFIRTVGRNYGLMDM